MQYNAKTRGQGYIITACKNSGGPFIRGAFHVEMDTKNWLYDNDESAARAAERDGVKLVYGIPYVDDGIYLDTPENRMLLSAYSARMEAAVQKRRGRTAV